MCPLDTFRYAGSKKQMIVNIVYTWHKNALNPLIAVLGIFRIERIGCFVLAPTYTPPNNDVSDIDECFKTCSENGLFIAAFKVS